MVIGKAYTSRFAVCYIFATLHIQIGRIFFHFGVVVVLFPTIIVFTAHKAFIRGGVAYTFVSYYVVMLDDKAIIRSGTR